MTLGENEAEKKIPVIYFLIKPRPDLGLYWFNLFPKKAGKQHEWRRRLGDALNASLVIKQTRDPLRSEEHFIGHGDIMKAHKQHCCFDWNIYGGPALIRPDVCFY